MKLVLLPAFDGTGRMFQPLIKELGDRFEAMPIAYPESGPQDYQSLSDYVLQQIPSGENYILLGESFAGPIVYQIACRDSEHCVAAVFVATYLTNPRPGILSILTRLPASLVLKFVSSPAAVRALTLSHRAADSVAGAIAENFASVDETVIKQRLKTIGSINTRPEETVEVPAFYIQASDDRLVLPKKLPDFKALCCSLTIDSVEGGHFVLQENPQASARVLLARLSEFQ